MRVRRETIVLCAYPYAQFRVQMLNLGYEIYTHGESMKNQGEHEKSTKVSFYYRDLCDLILNF